MLVRIAARNLLRNRSRTLLAASAVAVALWVMVSVHSFLESLHVAILHNLAHGETGYLQVHKKDYAQNSDARALRFTFADTADLKAKVRAVPGVTGITPRLVFGGALSMPEESGLQSQFLIFAVDPRNVREALPLPAEQIHEGRMLSSEDVPEIVLHRTIAQNLKIDLSKPAQPLDPEHTPALITYDADGVVKGRLLVPVGTYHDVFAGDRPFAMMPLVTAQNMLGLEGQVTEYVINIAEADDCERIQGDLRQALGDGYEVFRWDEKIPLIKQNFTIENVGFLIGVIIFFVVCALGSINTMMMTVMERTREIGTMMAVGMRDRQVIELFVTEGVMIAILSAVVGMLLGGLTVGYFAQSAFEMHAGIGGTTLPLKIYFQFEPLYMVKCSILALVGLAVASLLPARRAASMSPVEALQTA